MRRLLLPLIAALLLAAALAPPAGAAWFGSTMQGRPNASYGCESALVLGPIGGVELAPTGQRSCTYRHGGYLNSLRRTALVPRTGRITRIQVRSGPNPARLRLTILTGSARVNTFTGTQIPGTYTCCTARFVGPAFRPRPNATTTRRVNVPVFDVLSRELQIRIRSTDIVALSAVGPGTLPLRVDPSVGNLVNGTPLATGYWPLTGIGEPRVEGYTMAGIELMFRWDFQPRRR